MPGYAGISGQVQPTSNTQPTPAQPPQPPTQSWFSSAWNWLTRATSSAVPDAMSGLSSLTHLGDPAQAAGFSAAGQTGTAELLQPVMGAMNVPYRALSTVVTALNPASKANIAAQGGSLRDAWNASAQVSPAQALGSLPFVNSGNDTSQSNPTSLFGGIDPTDPAQRVKAFESGGIGEVESGLGDFAVSWLIDPTVLAAHAASPALHALRATGDLSADKIGANVEKLMVHGDQAAAGTAPAHPSGYVANAVDLWDHRGDMAYLLNHRVIAASTNPDALAGAIHNTSTWDQYVTTLASAWGDPAADARLSAQWPATHEALLRARTDAESANNALKNMPVPGTEGGAKNLQIAIDLDAARDRTAHWNAVVAQLTQEDTWLSKAVAKPTGDLGVFGVARYTPGKGVQTGFSPSRMYGEWQSAVAQRRANATRTGIGNDGYYVPDVANVNGTVVRIYRWAGTDAPSGTVHLAGAQAASAHKEVIATLHAAGATDEQVDRHVTAFVNATTPDQRQTAVLAMNEDLAKTVFTRELNHRVATGRAGDLRFTQLDDGTFGIDPDNPAYKTAKAKMDAGAKQYVALHDQAQQRLRARIDASPLGYIADEATGDQLRVESQNAQTVQVPDFKMLARALAHYDDTGFDKALDTGWTVAMHAVDTLGYLWKASVLLRLGAIPRNLGESWLAGFIALGQVPGTPVQGAENITANAYHRLVNSTRWGKPATWTLEENRTATLGRLQKQRALANRVEALADLAVAQSRKDGGQDYYASLEGARRLAPDEVADAARLSDGGKYIRSAKDRDKYADLLGQAEAGTLKKGKDTAWLRATHAQATRRYLRKQQAKGMDVVALRDGAYRPVDVDELTDAELTGGRLGKDVGGTAVQTMPTPDVHLMPRYSGARVGKPDITRAVKNPNTGLVDQVPAYSAVRANLPTGDPIEGVYGQSARDSLAVLHDRLDALTADIDISHADLQEINDEIAKRTARRKAGDTPIVGPNGTSAAGSRQGVFNEIAMRNTSAATKNSLAFNLMHTDRTQMNLFKGATAGQTMRVMPEDPNYFAHFAHWSNTNLLNSPVSLRLLAGHPIVQTADWMMHNPDGLASLELLGLEHADTEEVEKYLLGLNDALGQSIPSPWLAEKIAAGSTLTEADVKGALQGRDDLRPVYDAQLIPKPISVTSGQALDNFIDKWFHRVWTLPEDNLARFPLYRTIYTERVHSDLYRYADFLTGMSEKNANEWIRTNIERPAALASQQAVKRIVYSAERRTNPADQLRFIAPFLQVTTNRLAYYGAQVLENPVNMARLFLGWNAIQTDANGQIGVALPGPVARFFNIPDSDLLKFNKSSLNLISNSEPWWSPGFGPVVTTPVAHFLRTYAQNTPPWVTSFVGSNGIGMFPNNYYGSSDWDILLSSTERKVAQSQDPQQFVNNFAMVMTAEWAKYQNGARPDPPTMQEIRDRVGHLSLFKILASFTSPLQPTYQSQVLQPMVDLYRQFQQTYGSEADNQFYAQHPDMYRFVISLSKNDTGGNPTQEAAQRQDANRDLIASLHDPKLAAIITNLPSDSGTFDSAVYAWQNDQQVTPESDLTFRSKNPSAVSAIDQRLVSLGWQKYGDAVQLRDSLLASLYPNDPRPVGTLINLAGAAKVKYLFGLMVKKIETDTSRPDDSGHSVSPWFDDYSTQDNAFYANRAEDLARIVDDPAYVHQNIAVQPWLTSAQAYLRNRATINELLAQSAASGGSASITAKSNQKIQYLWGLMNKQLESNDPQWAKIKARYFSNDDLKVVPDAAN